MSYTLCAITTIILTVYHIIITGQNSPPQPGIEPHLLTLEITLIRLVRTRLLLTHSITGLGCTTTSQTHPPPRMHLLGANWRPWRLQIKLSLSQKVGCTAEVVTQSGTPVHPGWVVRDWRSFCHLGIKSSGMLSCNPAQPAYICDFLAKGILRLS